MGINDYREITPLQKAVGDAEALKVTLERLGFNVDLVLNADRREFNCAVSAFQTSLDPGDTALVHFSGHGVEIDVKTTYSLPTFLNRNRASRTSSNRRQLPWRSDATDRLIRRRDPNLHH